MLITISTYLSLFPLITYHEILSTKSNFFQSIRFISKESCFGRFGYFGRKVILRMCPLGTPTLLASMWLIFAYDGVCKTYINKNVIEIKYVIDYIIHILNETRWYQPFYHWFASISWNYMIKYDIYSYLLR